MMMTYEVNLTCTEEVNAEIVAFKLGLPDLVEYENIDASKDPHFKKEKRKEKEKEKEKIYALFFDSEKEAVHAINVLQKELPDCKAILKSYPAYLWKYPWQPEVRGFETSYFEMVPILEEINKVPDHGNESSKGGKMKIFLDPEAFGSGDHITTRTLLTLMEKHLLPSGLKHPQDAYGNFRSEGVFFDIGTGNGVLAAWAVKSGFKNVFASDLSEEILNSARSTFARNDIKGIRLLLDELPENLREVNVVVSNILVPELFKVLESIRPYVASDCKFFVTGFNLTNQSDMESYCKRSGLNILDAEHSEGWIALLLSPQICAKKAQI